MPKAFMVVGPESSGTRLVTRLLISGGCAGSGTHRQQWDEELEAEHDLLVWRRSYPHKQEWPDLTELVRKLQLGGYQVVVLVTGRDWYSMMLSQVRSHHPESLREARTNIRKAYQLINQGLLDTGVPFYYVNYETLVLGGAASTLEMLGLKEVEQLEEIRNENGKYY